jgi:hypothetical protein
MGSEQVPHKQSPVASPFRIISLSEPRMPPITSMMGMGDSANAVKASA